MTEISIDWFLWFLKVKIPKVKVDSVAKSIMTTKKIAEPLIPM